MWNPILTAEVVWSDPNGDAKPGQVINVVGFVWATGQVLAVWVDDYGIFHYIPAQMIRAENRVAVPA